MYWEIEIPIIIRSLINDLGATPTYSDDRILQLSVVAANYVTKEVNLSKEYNVDIINVDIIPDPSENSTRDTDFISFIALKSACLLDQSTFRTKAALEGIKTSLGSANISVAGNLAGYKTLLEMGPCKLYEQLVMDHNIGNATAVRAILSPFVGNDFDPRVLSRGYYGIGPYGNDIYG